MKHIHCEEDKVWNVTPKTPTNNDTRRRWLRKSTAAKKLEYPQFLLKSGKSKSKSSKSSKSKSSKSGKGSGKGKGSKSNSHSSSSKSSDDCDGMEKVPSLVPSVRTSLAPTQAPSDITRNPTSSPTIRPSQLPSPSPSIDSDSFPSQPPSSFPTIEFDLQICESYSRRWLIDLSRTCDSLFRNCECYDAQRLIDNGQIDCSIDVCPDDCTICNFCLEDVISCIPRERSVSPPLPSTTKIISQQQTTSMEDTFSLDTCSSYEDQWLRDLDSTCSSGNGGIKNCRCDDAQRRIEEGQISCDDFTCPDDCEVCKFCLVSILGCHSNLDLS